MKRAVSVFAAVMFVLAALPAASMAADAYPSKPINAIVPMAAGGSSDLLARAVEKFWPKYSKQPLVVINKPGGGGVVGTEGVVRSKPDGYTLYLGYGSGHDVVMPTLQKMPYDPLKDLVPVSRVSIHSVVIVTGAKSQFNSIKDIIAWSKKEGKPVTTAVSVKAGAVDLALTAFGARGGAPPARSDASRRPYTEGAWDRRGNLGLHQGRGRARRHAERGGPVHRRHHQEDLQRPRIPETDGEHQPAGHVSGERRFREIHEAGDRGLCQADQGPQHHDRLIR
jgi:hypothetical protein